LIMQVFWMNIWNPSNAAVGRPVVGDLSPEKQAIL